MILSQAKSPDGTIQPWANTPVGFSQNLIHAKGSAVVLLGEIMEVSPIEVNEKLKAVQGFRPDDYKEGDQIIWEKIVAAFPEWAAQYIEPYNNEVVLDALGKRRFVIVLVETEKGIHAVRYMGSGLCHDPLDGTEKPTITYPGVKAVVVITHIKPATSTDATPPQETISPIVKAEDKPFVTDLKVLGKPEVNKAREIEKQLKVIRIALIKIKKLTGEQ